MKLDNGVTLEKIECLPTPVPFPPGHVNSYLVLADEPVLIDAGMKTDLSWKEMEKGLARFDLKVSDIKHLLITHAHIDHFGQAAKIKEASGCKVYACEHEVPYFRKYMIDDPKEDDPNWDFFREWGVPEERVQQSIKERRLNRIVIDPIDIDVELRDGEHLTLGGVEFRGVWVPGHAIGHMVFFVDAQRVMFSADHLLPDISPVPLLNFPDPTKRGKTRSLLEFFESVRKVENENIQVALPSHGAPILDHRELIASYRLHYQHRRLKVERFLKEEGPLTPFQLAGKMFGEVRANRIMYLTMSEAIGHLEILEAGGEVEFEKRDGLYYYRMKSGK